MFEISRTGGKGINERIFELAEQAGFQSIVRGDHIVFDISTKENLKEFAELIVRECAQLAMTQHTSTCPDDYNEMDPYDKGRDDVASTISGLICRTFGVKL